MEAVDGGYFVNKQKMTSYKDDGDDDDDYYDDDDNDNDEYNV